MPFERQIVQQTLGVDSNPMQRSQNFGVCSYQMCFLSVNKILWNFNINCCVKLITIQKHTNETQLFFVVSMNIYTILKEFQIKVIKFSNVLEIIPIGSSTEKKVLVCFLQSKKYSKFEPFKTRHFEFLMYTGRKKLSGLFSPNTINNYGHKHTFFYHFISIRLLSVIYLSFLQCV